MPAALGQLPAIPEEHAAQLRDQGFCVVKGLLSAELLAEAVRSAQSTSAQLDPYVLSHSELRLPPAGCCTEPPCCCCWLSYI